jgi:hypothetical protein
VVLERRLRQESLTFATGIPLQDATQARGVALLEQLGSSIAAFSETQSGSGAGTFA